MSDKQRDTLPQSSVSSEPRHFVYVPKNAEGRLYIGSTSDLESRVRTRQAGEGGWTRTRGPWELVHQEVFADRAAAMRRERNLKRGKSNQELRRHYGAVQT